MFRAGFSFLRFIVGRGFSLLESSLDGAYIFQRADAIAAQAFDQLETFGRGAELIAARQARKLGAERMDMRGERFQNMRDAGLHIFSLNHCEI